MIIRSPRTANFSVISNDILNDTDIPVDSLGLLVYLLSKPDNWEIQVGHLQTRFGCGKERIYRMLKDLRICGYASYQRFADGTTNWTISETRVTEPRLVEPRLVEPDKEDQDDIIKTEKAVNTERSLNTDKSYRSNASLFDRWWAAYPKKVGKKTARAIWQRRKLDKLGDIIIADTVTRASVCQKWADGFIPNPSTYLNGDRWEDEMAGGSKRETHADRQLRIIRNQPL